ncbi:MAG: methylmalonyl-CoA mutase, partial [candidate division Zixibacteria bacterium]|nr:methylmalonyl-CoA mutase [candidate division Zixibacteria bacterium]
MSRIPDFTSIDFDKNKASGDFESWKKRVEKETGKSLDELLWQTMEMIDVRPLYVQKDIEDAEHLDYIAGLPPFLRGP